mgnify:CR=1 FL=1
MGAGSESISEMPAIGFSAATVSVYMMQTNSFGHSPNPFNIRCGLPRRKGYQRFAIKKF